MNRWRGMVSLFLKQKTEEQWDKEISTRELFDHFYEWCKRKQFAPGSRERFGKEIASRYTTRVSGAKRYVVGMAIKEGE